MGLKIFAVKPPLAVPASCAVVWLCCAVAGSLLARPVFETHPQSRVVAPGEPVLLESSARSAQPVSYRWELNGVLLSGMTNPTLTVTTHTNTYAVFRLPIGIVQVELFDQDKPVTVRNFMRYVRSGAYQNMVLHRWGPGFVIQGGGFYVTNRFTTNAEFASVPNFGTITNEFALGRRYSNLFGTISMAKLGGDPNSASSQWFFNLTNNSANLDSQNGGFTVFGKVIQGSNVLQRFNNTNSTNGIFLLSLPSPFNELPVLSRSPTFEDLVYSEITLTHRDAGDYRVIATDSSGSATSMTASVSVTVRPRLKILMNETNIHLSWEGWLADFAVESASQLTGPWQEETRRLDYFPSENQVTLPRRAEPLRFFRLKQIKR